jgi:hypothetical protein
MLLGGGNEGVEPAPIVERDDAEFGIGLYRGLVEQGLGLFGVADGLAKASRSQLTAAAMPSSASAPSAACSDNVLGAGILALGLFHEQLPCHPRDRWRNR